MAEQAFGVMEICGTSSALSNTAEVLLEKMMDCATNPEEYEATKMNYSEDDDDETEDDGEGDARKTKKGNVGEKTSRSYPQAAHAPNTQAGYKTPLKNTLICPLQLRASMLDVLLAIEDQKLDEDLEGVQLIRGNTVLEIVMKSERAKNRLLEGGLNIKGLHHRFQNSTPNRTPSRRTTVSIIGLPLEAKNFQVGRTLEGMGFGRHLYTRPVMKKTPTKGTIYYSGILVAVMEDLSVPMPSYISVRGYRVRAIHTGQGAGRPNMAVQQDEAAPSLPTEVEPKKAVKEIAEETIEEELTKIAEEVKNETTNKATNETKKRNEVESKQPSKNEEKKKEEQPQQSSEVEMTEEKMENPKKRKNARRKKSKEETKRSIKDFAKEDQPGYG